MASNRPSIETQRTAADSCTVVRPDPSHPQTRVSPVAWAVSAHPQVRSRLFFFLFLLIADSGVSATAAEAKDYRKPLPRTPAPGVVLPADAPASIVVVSEPPAAPPPKPVPVPFPVSASLAAVAAAKPAPVPQPVPVASKIASPPQAVVATQTPAPPSVQPVDQYVISANDVLWMKVYQEEDLESKPKVGRDGTINLPLLGTVTVGGLTLEQAREKIRAELDRRFIVNPQVSLSVADYSKRKFVVLGQVQRTGIYEYSGEEKMTLLQAIGMAGGYTRLAAPSRVTIQRQEKGLTKTIRVDAEGATKGVPVEILPDDTITVGTRIF